MMNAFKAPTAAEVARYAAIDKAQIIKLRGAGLFVACTPIEAAAMLEALGYVVVEPLAVDAWQASLSGCPVCGAGEVTR